YRQTPEPPAIAEHDAVPWGEAPPEKAGSRFLQGNRLPGNVQPWSERNGLSRTRRSYASRGSRGRGRLGAARVLLATRCTHGERGHHAKHAEEQQHRKQFLHSQTILS